MHKPDGAPPLSDHVLKAVDRVVFRELLQSGMKGLRVSTKKRGQPIHDRKLPWILQIQMGLGVALHATYVLHWPRMPSLQTKQTEHTKVDTTQVNIDFPRPSLIIGYGGERSACTAQRPRDSSHHSGPWRRQRDTSLLRPDPGLSRLASSGCPRPDPDLQRKECAQIESEAATAR